MPPFEMTQENVRALAEAYAPVLRFQAEERFFPTPADFWLGIQHGDSWTQGPRRGTAILRNAAGATTFGAGHALGGSFDGNGRQVEIDRRPGGPDDIANPDYTRAGSGALDLFLDVAGWRTVDNVTDFTAGNENYLLGLTLPLWEALRARTGGAEDASAARTTRAPVPPTLYAEVEWLGTVRELGTRIEAAGYAPAEDEAVPVSAVLGPYASGANDRLNRYFALSYHALFPALELSEDLRRRDPAANVRHREGQWVTLALLFRSVAPPTPDPATGRPAQFEFETLGEPAAAGGPALPVPTWVAYASGSARPSEDQPAFVARKWDDRNVRRVQRNHVEAYVTSGTHKLQPEPQLGRTVTTGGGTPVSDAFWIASGGALAIAGGFAIAAAVVGGTVPVALSTGPGVVAVILVDATLWAIALIFLVIAVVLAAIAAIAGLIERATNVPTTTTITSPTQDVDADLASGDGPAAVPAGVSVGPSSSGTGTPGSLGRPATAASEAAIALDVVNRFGDASAVPPWFDYTGRWGIQVARGGMRWRSGSYLRDREGRTPLYWAVGEAAREAGLMSESL